MFSLEFKPFLHVPLSAAVASFAPESNCHFFRKEKMHCVCVVQEVQVGADSVQDQIGQRPPVGDLMRGVV